MMIIRDGKMFRAKATIGGVNANQEKMGILCMQGKAYYYIAQLRQ